MLYVVDKMATCLEEVEAETQRFYCVSEKHSFCCLAWNIALSVRCEPSDVRSSRQVITVVRVLGSSPLVRILSTVA